jgi:hypothetical protein
MAHDDGVADLHRPTVLSSCAPRVFVSVGNDLGVHHESHGLALVAMLAITAISERLWMESVTAPLPPDHRGPIPTN